VPDSAVNRLHQPAAQRSAGDTAGADRVARDLADAAPDDGDLQPLAASYALDTGQTQAALASAEADAAADPKSAAAHIFRCRALTALGRPATARAAAKAALRCAPGSLFAHQQAKMLRAGTARFAEPGALWRRWISGAASLHEGHAVAAGARLAVVVLSFRAPAALRAAVASVCAQKPRAEIVVVNSGGGDPRRLLAPHLGRIRLIDVAEPLFVGAIRNIGVDASTAPFVAFLAADCIARPGWVSQRLALHRAGAEAVSSPVIPHRRRNPFSRVSNALLHRRRRRDTPDPNVSHYGVSYARRALLRTGYFPPGLRTSEDTVFNGWLRKTAKFHYGRNVVTLHRYPTGPLTLLRDAHARGARRVPLPPFGPGPGGDPGAEPDWERMAQDRLTATLAAPGAGPGKGWRLAVWRWLLRLTIRADQRGTQRALVSAREALRLREQAALAADDDGNAALVLADRALALDPLNLRCLMLCARLRLQRGGEIDASVKQADHEEAIALLRRAVALAPNGIGALSALCAALRAAGRSVEAIDAAEFHALSAPRNAQLWVFAAKTAEKARQFRRSRLMWQMALVAGPQLPEPHLRLAARHEREGLARASEFRRAAGEGLEVIRQRRSTGG
jgi:tetratricopeptide (TPR) repeat protein